MKKQNVIDLLCDDFIEKYNKKESIFSSCIKDFDECQKEYILPFLELNQKNYNLGFEFNVNSSNELEKLKSEILFELVCRAFKNLIIALPDVFKQQEKEEDFESAVAFTTNNVMIGNVTDFKITINKIASKYEQDKQ